MMAAQTSLLPVYHKTQDLTNPTDLSMDLSTWMTQEHSLQDEAFLQELLSGQGVSLDDVEVDDKRFLSCLS